MQSVEIWLVVKQANKASEKSWTTKVSWDYDIPNIMEK